MGMIVKIRRERERGETGSMNRIPIVKQGAVLWIIKYVINVNIMVELWLNDFTEN